MELFQEFLFAVALSLLVSFVIAKVISMASYDDDTVTGDNSVSVSVIGVIEEAGFCEQDRDEKPVVWDSESGGRVCFVDKVVGFNELEEEDEEAKAETVRSPLTCENDEVVDCDNVLKEFVFSDKAKGGALDEERAVVGGGGFEVNLVSGSSEKEKFREIGISSEGLFGKGVERARFRDIEIESAEEVRVLESSEENRGNESERLDQSIGNEDEEEVGLFDDWEGIERTELEKRFGAAVVFVGSKSNADRISSLDSDTQMQLYGLHKAAIEGPCRVPQPMALKVSARAKWAAWRQLGDMSPEVAMEQYLTLLSKSIPGWMGADVDVSSDQRASPNLPSNLHKQAGTDHRSISEREPCDKGGEKIGVEDSSSIEIGKE